MNSSVLRWLASCAAVMTLATPALSQTCFLPVGGVPGAYSQPPDWWSTGATPLGSDVANTFVDDPRWQNATAFSHISDNGRFRVLVETSGAQRYFDMAWRVKADPSGIQDRLYVGFWDETSHQGNVFRLEKLIGTLTATAGQSYADSAYNGRFFNRTGATGNSWALNNAASATPPPLPTWLKNYTRVDVFCPGGTCNQWAIRMRIPIDSAADVTSDDPTGVKITTGGVFRFWYQIQDESGIGTAALYGWPEGLGPAQETNPPCGSIPPYCFPDPLDATNGWLRVQDGSASCNGDISIKPEEIYANSPGSITVNLSSTNHFHATPTNNTTSVQPGNAVKATFRLANWGSTLFDSPAWQPICTDVVGAAGSIASNGQFDMDCSYDVPDPCAFKPPTDPCGPTHGTRNTDQCVLIDLGSAGGGGPYQFSPQSAWQNMSFTGASTVQKLAELDTRGEVALPVPAPNRDLYVYISTENMPAEQNPEAPPIDFEKFPRAREVLAKLKIEVPRAGGLGKAAGAAIAQAFAAGKLTGEDVALLMPTYIANVWYDTGKTLVGSGGTPLKILAPQPSFGMFLSHDGALYGWRHRFEGSTVTELAPNYFRVRAPTNGVVKVTTTVTACEKAGCADAPPAQNGPPPPSENPPPGVWHWLRWALLLLLLLILFIWLARRK